MDIRYFVLQIELVILFMALGAFLCLLVLDEVDERRRAKIAKRAKKSHQ